MPTGNLPLAMGLGEYKVVFGSVAASSGAATINTGLNTIVSVSLSASPVTKGDYAFATVADISGGTIGVSVFEAAAGSAPAAGTTNTIYYVAIGY
ncbi:MAG: hypothetical protein QW292_08430 [Candidatus Parvarchaeota archaeon]